MEFLLDHNVATNVKDNDDWQPVHAAACWGHVSILCTNTTSHSDEIPVVGIPGDKNLV